jgi:hypothetical protein
MALSRNGAQVNGGISMTKSKPTSLSDALLAAAKLDDRYSLDTIKARAVEAFDQWLLYEAPDPTGPQPRGRIEQITHDALPCVPRQILALLNHQARLQIEDAHVSDDSIEQAITGLFRDEIINGTGGLVSTWKRYCEGAQGVW